MWVVWVSYVKNNQRICRCMHFPPVLGTKQGTSQVCLKITSQRSSKHCENLSSDLHNRSCICLASVTFLHVHALKKIH